MIVQLLHSPHVASSKSIQAISAGPPIGLAYIAAAIRGAGHPVTMIDALAEAPRQYTQRDHISIQGLTQDQILDRIAPETQVIGISCMSSPNWTVLKPIIHAIKQRYPDKIIICGGEHFSALPEYSMQNAPIDFIVMGEGEITIVALLDKLQNQISPDFSTVPGIAWRDRDGNIVRNCAVKSIRDVDSILWPAWDLVDLNAYFDNNIYATINPGTKTLPILATRGCPYECTYCSSPSMWTRRWYPRDPVKVADEIEYYAKTYGVDHFPLQDLTPLMKREWIQDFCQELIRRNLGIKWHTQSGTRSEIITPEILKLLKASGCDTLYYAPETGSDRVRVGVKKYMKMDRLFQAIQWTIEADLNLGIFIVLGLPDETEEDIKETVRLSRKIARLGVVDSAPTFYIPLPGTELFDELIAEGRLQLNDETLLLPTFGNDLWITEDRNMCRHVSAKRLTLYKLWILLNFYVTSWLTHPKRLFGLFSNIINDRDSTKMSKALNSVKRRYLSPLFRRHSTEY